MSLTVRDVASDGLVTALEDNWWGYLRCFSLAPQVEVYDRDVRWYVTGIPAPDFNGVMWARLTHADVDAAIERVRAKLAERGVPWGWLVGPDSRPTDLGSHLEAHGFTHAGSLTPMAADLAAATLQIPLPSGLEIATVDDERLWRAWIDAERAGFEPPDEVATGLDAIRARMGAGRNAALRHYLGLRNGRPVATASLFLGGGVAGIYDVSTVPRARRLGIGAALTAWALRDACSRGYRVAVLQPSAMGLGVYRRLGFAECCTVDVYAP